MDEEEDHQVKAPLAVEEGEGEGWETTSLGQGDQVDDYQEPWSGFPSPVGDLREEYPFHGLAGGAEEEG